MKKNILLIAILIFSSIACGLPFSNNTRQSNTPTVFSTASTNAATSPVSAIKLGEPYLSTEGGYSLKKISNYSFAETSGAITMLAPNADPESGPAFFLAGGLNKAITTNEDLMTTFKNTSTGAKVSNEKAVVIKNVNGLSADLTGTINGQPIKGRLVVAMVTPFHQFMMMANAPAAKWDQEISVLFDAVVASIEFTTPAVTTIPTQPSPARTNTAAVRTNTPPVPTTATGEIRQWAKSATASSQASTSARSAAQATGAPNTEKCGDSTTAWMPLNASTVEWIELTFEIAVFPTEINILQSWNPSQVSKVEMITTTGEKYQVYEGKPVIVDYCPDEYSFTLELTKKIYVNKVRITVDQSVLKIGKVQIDAVELVGIPEANAQAQPTRTSTPRIMTATAIQPTKAGQPTATAKAGGTLTTPNVGKVSYQVNGSPEDGIIPNAGPSYKSTDREYIVNLTNWDKPNILLTMYWMKSAPLSTGDVKLKPYDKSEVNHGPTFIIIINIPFYYTKEGSITIEAVEDNTITGKFTFTAYRQDNPNVLITVNGLFNKLPIK